MEQGQSSPLFNHVDSLFGHFPEAVRDQIKGILKVSPWIANREAALEALRVAQVRENVDDAALRLPCQKERI